MAPEPQALAGSGLWPEDLRQVRGRVEKVRFQSLTGDFAVLTVVDGQTGQQLTAKGPLWGLHVGETVQLVGKLERDSRFGVQFAAEAGWPVIPATAKGLLQLLQSDRFSGVGAVLAERIVEALGPKPLETLQEQPEVLATVKGLGKRQQEAVAAGLVALDGAESAWLALADLGVSPGLCRRLVRAAGPEVVRLVRERPWSLVSRVRGMGFATADRLAAQVGFAADHPDRLLAGVRQALVDLSQQGHTAPPLQVLAERVAWLLQSTADKEAGTQPAIPDLTATLTQLQAQNEVLCDGELICLPALATAEQELADDLLRRLARPPLPLDSLTLQGALVRAEQALGFALQGQQRAAVELALRVPLVVITGGPGTGKTTILRGLLAALTGMTPQPRVALAAPTGRAARRLAESTGLEARTLHRLLEFEPHTERFGRQHDHQLEVDWLVLDEVSMMEVPLAAAVVAALPATARLVLVGDADQLPSVGPGSVLADLLRAEAVPRVALQQVFRQGSQSLIPLAAQQVRQGLLPTSATGPDGDFYHVVRETQEEIAAAVLEIVQQRLPKRGFDPVLDVQVLTPMHRGLLGTRQLGDLLGNALRPAQPGAALPGGFSAGDKVLQLRNDYDREVFNGDVGVVEGPGTPQSSGLGVVPTVTIRFGDRRLDLSADELDDITQAFVLTVHKSQGSEYPAVILPLHPSQHLMLQRNLLYTAITRARRFCVVVGPLRALQRAVQTDAPLARHTRLARLLGAPMLADRSDMPHD